MSQRLWLPLGEDFRLNILIEIKKITKVIASVVGVLEEMVKGKNRNSIQRIAPNETSPVTSRAPERRESFICGKAPEKDGDGVCIC